MTRKAKERNSNGEGSITQLKNGLWQARISRREPDGNITNRFSEE